MYISTSGHSWLYSKTVLFD